MNRTEYVQKCKEDFMAFMNAHQDLSIHYIRSKSPPQRPEDIKVSKEQAVATCSLLDITGDRLSDKSYVRILKILSPQEVSMGEFSFLRREWKARHSMRRGVVVLYTKNEQTMIGWSLCHPTDRNKWNRHIGLVKAISTAVELKTALDEHISGEMPMPELVLSTLRRRCLRDERYNSFQSLLEIA